MVWLQLPEPLHVPTNVAVPAEHEGLPQFVVVGSAWQARASAPLHEEPHVVPAPLHATRSDSAEFRRTDPVTVTHVPAAPATSHA